MGNLQVYKRDESHIPEDSIYWKEKLPTQRAWLRVDRLNKKMPAKLEKWLDSQGFDCIPERHTLRNGIDRRLKKAGVYEVARQWRIDAAREMRSWEMPTIPPTVAKEIAWRLVELKVSDLKPEVEQQRAKVVVQDEDIIQHPESIEGMEFLPEWMRWCVMHPGLLLEPEVIHGDPVLKATCDKYVELYPCPHQAAMNQFLLYQGDKKLIDGMFKEIARLHLAAMKMAGSTDPSDENPEDSEEAKSIETLASILGE